MTVFDFIVQLDVAYKELDQHPDETTINLIGGIISNAIDSIAYCEKHKQIHIYTEIGRNRHDEQHS